MRPAAGLCFHDLHPRVHHVHSMIIASWFCRSHRLPALAQEPKKDRDAVAKRPEVIALRAARLFDGTGRRSGITGMVVVQDSKILAAGKTGEVNVPAGAREIDLGDVTLLPGLIDAHTHIVGRRVLGNPGQEASTVRNPEWLG